MFSSIRHGLFAALAGFTLLICLCYMGLALVIAYVTEDMLVDRLLQREAGAVAAYVRAHGVLPPPGAGLARVHAGADTLPPAVRERVAAGQVRAEIFTGTGSHYHLRTLEVQGRAGRVYLVLDAGPLLVVSKLIREVGAIVLLVALGLVGLALLLAWLLSRRLVRPLQVLAREVRSLRPGDAADFSARRRRDEIGYLADRLGTTIGELQAALAREHAFTRDVSHELRTPLTVMNNALATQDTAQLRTSLDEIGATIDVLFALARAGHVPSDVLDLRGCIEDALLRLLDGGGLDPDRLVLQLPERLDVRGNRHLCMLLVQNCLGNALFHGGPGARLRLSFADGVLSLANTVDAGRAGGTQGFLHGQDLLRRIAAAMHWELGFHAEAGAYRVDILPLRS